MYFLAIITTISLPIFLVAISAANGQTVQPDSDPSPNNPSAFLLPDTFHVNSIRTTRLRDQRRSNILVEFRRVHEDPWDESEEKEYGRRWGSVSSTKVHCEINWKGSSRPKMAHYVSRPFFPFFFSLLYPSPSPYLFFSFFMLYIRCFSKKLHLLV